ncbi:MAG TPA: hypothetical protein VFC31_13450 [Candidatus Limnocylindria bacterium]|nr:hypothetical protein [Candidatus Limnocylindria bacterium]
MTYLGGLAAFVAVATAGLAVLAPVGVPLRPRHPDASALALVLPGWSLARWEGARLIVIGCAGLVAAASGLWPLVPGAAIAPSLVLRHRLGRLRDAAASRSVEILHATHAAMRTGLPLAPALRLALERVDPSGAEPFQRALRAFELNAGFDDAFRVARAEARDRRVVLALDALALVASEQLPAARGAEQVASVADRLTFERRLAEEVRASTNGLRTQIVVLALLVPAIAAYLALTMPGLGATLATPLGRYVLVPVAIVLELAGVLASRALVRGLFR